MICTAPPVTPYTLGPTWQKTEDGNWLLPERTLGWFVIGWIGTNLQLDGGPFPLTGEQMRLILWIYAIDDRGRFIYRDIVLQRMKGWGKDPLAAIIAAVEFVGPCRFGGWREDGTPIAVESKAAWVQISAVSEEQTKNTMSLMAALFTKACIAKHGIDIGKQVIYAYSGARRIEITSSNYRTMEGNRPTFVIRNETHHWLATNDGLEVHKVIRRNLAKIPGGQARAMSITNAYSPGEGSVAQAQREAYLEMLAGNTPNTGMLYDSLEAPVGVSLFPDFTHWDEDGNEVRELQPDGLTTVPPSDEVVREHIRRILLAVRGDAVWLDVDRLIEEILDAETTLEEAKRFYFNSISLGDDKAFDPVHIQATADIQAVQARRGPVDFLRCSWSKILPTDPIVIFGDGSKSNDSTGLMGCRLSDGYVFTIGVWQKPPGGRGKTWLAPRDEVDARVREAFNRFNVVAFWFDPSHTKDDDTAGGYWDTLIMEWHLAFADRLQFWAVQGGERRSAIMWDMASPVRQVEFVQAVATFGDDLESHAFLHDGHPTFIKHLENSRATLTAHGWSIAKASRTSSKKIDLAVCAIGARMLRRVMAVKGLEDEKDKPAKVWW